MRNDNMNKYDDDNSTCVGCEYECDDCDPMNI